MVLDVNLDSMNCSSIFLSEQPTPPMAQEYSIENQTGSDPGLSTPPYLETSSVTKPILVWLNNDYPTEICHFPLRKIRIINLLFIICLKVKKKYKAAHLTIFFLFKITSTSTLKDTNISAFQGDQTELRSHLIKKMWFAYSVFFFFSTSWMEWPILSCIPTRPTSRLPTAIIMIMIPV